MIGWQEFSWVAGAVLVLWCLGAVLELLRARFVAVVLGGGWILLLAFVVLFWISLERPPLRTLGETRLWYAALLPLCGFLVRWRWKVRWLNWYCLAMASLFLVINLLHPEAHDKTLMPALRSPWFVPHVIVYLVAYALLGASAMVGCHGLWVRWRARGTADEDFALGNRFVLLGFAFLTSGLLFGALWAKEAWGHYWTWDPKETWALLTWLVYLIYLHANWHRRKPGRGAFVLLTGAFLVLLGCWFGVNYLPGAQTSVHVYSQ